MRIAVEIILVLILLAIAVYTVISYRKKLTKGCCGAGDGGTIKKVRVKDRNKSHYPYKAVLGVDGMVCANCANRVANALNTLPGVWASVDAGEKRAVIRMKEPLEESVLRKAVNDSGYTALKIDWIQSDN